MKAPRRRQAPPNGRFEMEIGLVSGNKLAPDGGSLFDGDAGLSLVGQGAPLGLRAARRRHLCKVRGLASPFTQIWRLVGVGSSRRLL